MTYSGGGVSLSGLQKLITGQGCTYGPIKTHAPMIPHPTMQNESPTTSRQSSTISLLCPRIRIAPFF